LKEKDGLIPGLATILVGEDPGSKVYVGQKEKACNNLGIYSARTDLPADTSEAELLDLVKKLNNDPKIHGILVQLPLPKHIDAERVIYAIDPDKDVDCFHPVNVGKLMIGAGVFLPCTPHGIVELLRRSDVRTDGKHVVVVGRSNIVGKPMANLMLQPPPGGNATVTLCHTGTKDLGAFTKMADILIVAVGRPKTITADMVKDGVVVIDVGVNRIGKTPEGKAILAGDVDFDAVQEKAAAITPVPGGVGPMTITMLMKNTVAAAKASISG
ncbi:MAG: tetrahydrofolate dehydrogenase/cyclohydrolase catalytic domain-containing protein, partial [Deltaproteobacteria bacterium]